MNNTTPKQIPVDEETFTLIIKALQEKITALDARARHLTWCSERLDSINGSIEFLETTAQLYQQEHERIQEQRKTLEQKIAQINTHWNNAGLR